MLVFIVILLLSFPFVLLIMLLPAAKRIKPMHHLLEIYSTVWLTLIGVRTTFYNHDLLHSSGSSIIVPNHSSYLDAAIIYRTIDVVFLTLGKIEIAKAPLFGIIYKTVVVLVDRSSVVARAKSFLQMTSMLEQGIDILIFPEGTFDEHDSDLKPFHDGAFKLAMHAKKPLLPILFVDARQRMHPRGLWQFTPGRNRIVYLPSIDIANWPKGTEKELKAFTYDYMNTMLNHCRQHGCKDSLQVATQWLAAQKKICHTSLV